ncbi:MAG: hypothetical protein P8166_14405, partial [Candidatus Thiodiazotropha sp.]
MKHLRNGLLLGALISLTGIANAQPPIPSDRGPMPFAVFDLNRDGSISQQEFETAHAQRRQAPNPQGYSARRRYDPPRFADFDQNGDGALSPEELAQGQVNRARQRQPPMWGSGQGADAPAYPGMGPGMGRGMGPGMGRGMGPGGRSGMGPGRGRNMPAFSEFDLNSDGLLQSQEFEEARAQRIRERSQQGYMMRN